MCLPHMCDVKQEERRRFGLQMVATEVNASAASRNQFVQPTQNRLSYLSRVFLRAVFGVYI
jgi:hypothetical protein